MIDGKQFSSVRKRVMRKLLIERGFSLVNAEYVQKQNGQSRYVSFSSRKYGHGFEVGIALHLDFLPAFSFMVWPGAPIPKEMCRELCAFGCTIRSPAGAQFYEYGESVDEAESVLTNVTGRALERLEQVGELVGDGVLIIERITPETLANDLQLFIELICARTLEEQRQFSQRMITRQLFPDGTQQIASTAIILASIARYHGLNSLTRRYLDVAQLSSQPGLRMDVRNKPYIEELEAWYACNH